LVLHRFRERAWIHPKGEESWCRFMRFLQGLSSWVKTAAYVIFVIATQGWQAAGVIAIAIYNNRPWECLFIFLGFVVGRRFFGTTYHAPSLWVCTIITWVTFYFLTAACPSFHVSISIPCILGVILAFALSKIADLIKGGGEDV
jgi:hypothetical protein